MGSVFISKEHLHSVLGWRLSYSTAFGFNRGYLQLMLNFCVWN